ncbi:MAG: threonylcarbamoyl-AMP synthase [Candidatus Wildermuthbacteria bacterium]|nr:threonylcarbamoyl-AMP synthase [Candidatus Wildermuthbacteria bacterium]
MRIISVPPEKDTSRFIKNIVEALGKGKVVAAPTDTVYGLLADATNAKSVNKIFKIKQREIGKPLYVFVADIAMARKFATIEESKEEFLKSVWPGKVTVIFKSKSKLPKELGTEQTVGFRIPNHDIILRILRQFGGPITGTSANISGTPSVLDSKEVISQFEGKEFQPDIVIDAGKIPHSLPSTVIDWTGKDQKIVRKGA